MGTDGCKQTVAQVAVPACNPPAAKPLLGHGATHSCMPKVRHRHDRTYKDAMQPELQCPYTLPAPTQFLCVDRGDGPSPAGRTHASPTQFESGVSGRYPICHLTYPTVSHRNQNPPANTAMLGVHHVAVSSPAAAMRTSLPMVYSTSSSAVVP